MSEAQADTAAFNEPDTGNVINLLHRRVAANVRAVSGYHRDRQVAIAKVLGISSQQVSQRMNDRTPFTLDEVGKLAARWGMTPGELVDGRWAPWDSNPQPADYKMAGSARVLPFPRHAARRTAGPVITRRAS